ncbi:hypothetical protein ADK67_09990 [Saccharothrix sp. NRRL B-16348]|uniref:hypothetical protein n=1 Tax=Saccharothrix sp. NRRL B-16348 TaxID=1415542 RepID=UPI0006AFDC98|nr:hypothetical protein [Saccharothrix sp. NRRL B-16348]KOX30081.1 hypothetical protein ADK67_09990 [Saccharothrix sp. NRRL B-16348]
MLADSVQGGTHFYGGIPAWVLLVVVVTALALLAGLVMWVTSSGATTLHAGRVAMVETTTDTTTTTTRAVTSSVSTTTTTVASTTTTARVSRVFWQGTLSLGMATGNISFSLDQNPPNAGDYGTVDLLYQSDGEVHELMATAVAPWEAGGVPVEDQCAERLNSVVGLQQVEVEQGTTLCFLTNRGRRGVLTVTEAVKTSLLDASVTLAVTVWDLQK